MFTKLVEVRGQDFTKKMAIVVRDDLPPWQVLNVVSHIAAYLGNKMKVPFDTGEWFMTHDGVRYPRNSQFPIIVLSAKEKDLRPFMQAVRDSKLPYLAFIREMIETTDDTELQATLSKKTEAEIEYLGIGVFGSNDIVKPLTKRFSLWTDPGARV